MNKKKREKNKHRVDYYFKQKKTEWNKKKTLREIRIATDG